MDGELDYIELLDQYAEGHIDYSELVQAMIQADISMDVDTALNNYRLALECLHMGYLKMQLQIIHRELTETTENGLNPKAPGQTPPFLQM